MREKNKARFFIHNGPGVNTNCADDTADFLRKHVVSSKDVLFTDLTEPHSYDQLDSQKDNPVFVVPGGSAVAILSAFEISSYEAISTLINQRGFHYIGICAGAYLGSNKMKILGPRTWETPYPIYEGLEGGLSETLRLSSCWDSIGALYPDDAESRNDPRILDISVGSRQIPQLNIGGPAFSKNNFSDTDDGSKPLAYYPDYMKNFKYKEIVYSTKLRVRKENFLVIPELVAILSREPRQEAAFKSGGIFLSGNHFEACGVNSKLLKACNEKLSIFHYKKVKKLEESEKLIAETLAPLIKKSIGLGDN